MAAAESHRGVFMLAENSSFWPEVTRAKQLLDAGAIGELVTARSHYYEALNSSPFADEGEVRAVAAAARCPSRQLSGDLCGHATTCLEMTAIGPVSVIRPSCTHCRGDLVAVVV